MGDTSSPRLSRSGVRADPKPTRPTRTNSWRRSSATRTRTRTDTSLTTSSRGPSTTSCKHFSSTMCDDVKVRILPKRPTNAGIGNKNIFATFHVALTHLAGLHRIEKAAVYVQVTSYSHH